MRGMLRGVETRDGPADRYAVPGFHLQVAALSLKTGARLTCHLSDCTARPTSALQTLMRNDLRGLTSGETQACSQCGAVVMASSNHGEIFRRLEQQNHHLVWKREFRFKPPASDLKRSLEFCLLTNVVIVILKIHSKNSVALAFH